LADQTMPAWSGRDGLAGIVWRGLWLEMKQATLVSSRVRRARVNDAGAIQQLITTFAERDEMLHRPLGEIYENIRDFYVAEDADGRIVGCGGLHVCWSHLAEVKSLAVDEACQGQGHGRRIVEACIEEARELGLRTVFALTYRPEFFARLGFRVVDKATLPHKVWNECIRCPKFPACGEIAVVYDLDRTGPPPFSLPVLGSL
jgi:amino-acid N-acetyltransferase